MEYGKGKFPGWWDWTSYAEENPDLMARARVLTLDEMQDLSRPGFEVRVFDTPQEFFLEEALEYVRAFMRSTPDNPVGVCGPVGPTEHLPLVAAIINQLRLDVRSAHFMGMDEFAEDGKAISGDHPLSFQSVDLEMCFDRFEPELRMPDAQLHFPTEDIDAYTRAWDGSITVALTQGGQGNTKHFAFNDPLKREGEYAERPPSVKEYAALTTRLVELHPATIIQDARHSNGGEEWQIPSHAFTVGPAEVLGRSECISIWHPGHHDNAFGIRLTTLMLAEQIVDARVPMSLLAWHGNVRFSLLRPGIGNAGVEMK